MTKNSSEVMPEILSLCLSAKHVVKIRTPALKNFGISKTKPFGLSVFHTYRNHRNQKILKF